MQPHRNHGGASHNEYHAEVPCPPNTYGTFVCEMCMCLFHRLEKCTGAGAGVDDCAERWGGGGRRAGCALCGSHCCSLPLLPATEVAHGAAVPTLL